jgi:hypothetical protein
MEADMGLNQDDRLPIDISLVDAYTSVRRWYLANMQILKENPRGSDCVKLEALVHALPPVSRVTGLEIRAVLGEILYGNLEWAYHRSDGNYKMGAYAHAGLGFDCMRNGFDMDEMQELKASRIWPYLSIELYC